MVNVSASRRCRSAISMCLSVPFWIAMGVGVLVLLFVGEVCSCACGKGTNGNDGVAENDGSTGFRCRLW